MSIGDIRKLACVWSDSTLRNVNVNVFHFRQNSAIVAATDPEDLVGRFLDEVATPYAACVSASLTLRTIQYRTLAVPAQGQDFSPSGVVGTLSGAENLPRQNAPVVSWRSSTIGKRYRGRTYMPLITESHQNDGVLGAGYVTAATAFANAMLDMTLPNASWGEYSLVVRSRVGGFSTIMTSFVVQPIICTQRRRRFGVGG
jgi:hypothetical protein